MDPILPTDPSGCQVVYPDPIPRILLHASVNVVSGASGAGKTILMAEWMQRLRDGRSICGHLTNKPTAIYHLAADRDWRTYAAAYAAAGFADVERYVLAEDPAFDPRAWGKKRDALTLFEDCLKCLGENGPIPGSVVNVDPVAPIFIQGNQNDARDVALSLHWYRKIARKYQITLLLYANTAKQKQDDGYRRPQDRISGSGAFVAYSDTQIALEQDEDRVLTLRLVPRRHPYQEFLFQFDAKTELFIPYVATAAGLSDAQLAVLALVPLGESITSPELVRLIMAKLSLKRAMAFRHIQHLIEREVIVRSELGIVTRSLPKPKQADPTDPSTPVDR